MEKNILFANLTEKMEKTLATLNHELSGLRTGRAAVSFLDPVRVDAYGSKMPLSQVSSITIGDNRTLLVQVWDSSLTKSVEKAIVDSNLGVSVVSAETTLRIMLPMLTEERRKELSKLAHKYAENAKVAIRNVRRDGMDFLKTSEKEGQLSKDDHRHISDEVQKLTDDYVKKIDSITENKQKEILS